MLILSPERQRDRAKDKRKDTCADHNSSCSHESPSDLSMRTNVLICKMDNFRDLVEICSSRLARSVPRSNQWNIDLQGKMAKALENMDQESFQNGQESLGNTQTEVPGLKESLEAVSQHRSDN